jgi:hypothetical protein
MRRGGPLPAILVTLLIALLLATASAVGVGVPPRVLTAGEVTAAVSLSAHLAVDPATWVLPAGGNATFVATWVPSSPACTAVADWFRWSLASAFADGSLDAGNTSAVVFDAASAQTGSTTLEARSSVSLDCGGVRDTFVAAGFANVTVIAPFALENLSVEPSVVEPGSNASLTGIIAGGEPPFVVEVRWGDGTSSAVRLVSPGSFSLSHRYSSGTFVPSATADDSSGLNATATVEEPVVATSALAVGLVPRELAGDVGVAIPWLGAVINAPSSFEWGSACGRPTSWILLSTGPPEGSCTFTSAGTGAMYLAVRTASLGAEAVGMLDEDVRPDPTLELSGPEAPAEVGTTARIGATLEGGVPPFELSWSLVGSELSGTMTVAEDGQFLLPICPIAPGSFTLSVRVADAAGGSTGTVAQPLAVAPPLNDTVVLGSTENGSVGVLEIEGTVAEGTAPYDWAVATSPASVGSAPSVGVLNGTPSFEWSARFAAEGAVAVTVVVVDASGAWSVRQNATVAVPLLAGAISVDANRTLGAGRLGVAISLSGGLSPFSAVVVAGGQRWNWTIPADGSTSSSLEVTPGVYSVEVVVTDALGYELTANGTTNVSAGAAPLPSEEAGGGAASAVGIAAVLALGGGGLFLLVRRRRRGVAPATAFDPREVLQRIIAPADGADRATVELLAEEAGIPLETARTTLDRLVREGAVRSEVDADGTEVVSWEAPTPP